MKTIKLIKFAKKTVPFAILLLFFLGCSDNNINNKNAYLPNYTFSVELNLNLPAYSNLQYPSNAVYYSGAGVRGLYIFNTGTGYNAFDAACPNQNLSSCSTMTLKGIFVTCPCDNTEYNLFTGQGGLEYPLKQYRVEYNGNVIRVYN